MANKKPILCLDFDGVCHSYTSGWKGADVIPDPPVEGLFEFLEEALEHFEVHIFSSRSNLPGGIEAMIEWFSYWDYCRFYEANQNKFPNTPVKVSPVAARLHFPKQKPPAHISIDDRAITFTGKWPVMTYLRDFKPWNGNTIDTNNGDYEKASQ